MKATFYFILSLSFSFFCYGQNFPEKFEDNSKFGVKYLGKIILPAVYNDIITYPLVVAIKGDERTIYDNKMSLLYKNSEILTYVFLDEYEKIQILTKDRRLVSYDEHGLISDTLKLNPNESIDNKSKQFESTYDKYSIKKGKIHKEGSDSSFLEKFDYKSFGENAKFLNNKKEMEIESIYSKGTKRDTLAQAIFDEEIYFKPLKINYIVSKIKGKYGVWDFINEKIILPFNYQKIVPFHNYLLIEKNGLVTFYPNIGTEPKYKKLEPYIGHFARFETPDGKKGWVDRKGKEYFDE